MSSSAELEAKEAVDLFVSAAIVGWMLKVRDGFMLPAVSCANFQKTQAGSQSHASFSLSLLTVSAWRFPLKEDGRVGPSSQSVVRCPYLLSNLQKSTWSLGGIPAGFLERIPHSHTHVTIGSWGLLVQRFWLHFLIFFAQKKRCSLRTQLLWGCRLTF